ncbi:MAG: hypothetical protein Q9160_003139 [Pyrenula sp. 1 TL-2023]
MRGFLHGSRIIAREKGIRGFFQGFVPTTARQAANSATRFGSYTTLKQFAQSYVAPGEKLGAISTFALGGMAGFITVYVPDARQRYRLMLIKDWQICDAAPGHNKDEVSWRRRQVYLKVPQVIRIRARARGRADEGFLGRGTRLRGKLSAAAHPAPSLPSLLACQRTLPYLPSLP